MNDSVKIANQKAKLLTAIKCQVRTRARLELEYLIKDFNPEKQEAMRNIREFDLSIENLMNELELDRKILQTTIVNYELTEEYVSMVDEIARCEKCSNRQCYTSQNPDTGTMNPRLNISKCFVPYDNKDALRLSYIAVKLKELIKNEK